MIETNRVESPTSESDGPSFKTPFANSGLNPEVQSLQHDRLRLYEKSQRDVGLWFLLIGTMVILGAGYAVRDEYWFVPDRGMGYALGIFGLAAMTSLLGYSIRKHARFARRWGSIRTWFRIHMFLGLAGPCAVLLHCNFSLGSTNANAALACVLAVSASGVIGRLLYGRIHAGLFGRRLNLLELRSQLELDRQELARNDGGSAVAAIAHFEKRALAPAGIVGGTARLFLLPWQRRNVLRAVGESSQEDLEQYLRAVQRVSAFAVYERLFGLWHAVHLPVCVVLFAAAALHVVAVTVF